MKAFANHKFQPYKQDPIDIGGAKPLKHSEKNGNTGESIQKYDPLKSWKLEALQNYQK